MPFAARTVQIVEQRFAVGSRLAIEPPQYSQRRPSRLAISSIIAALRPS